MKLDNVRIKTVGGISFDSLSIGSGVADSSSSKYAFGLPHVINVGGSTGSGYSDSGYNAFDAYSNGTGFAYDVGNSSVPTPSYTPTYLTLGPTNYSGGLGSNLGLSGTTGYTPSNPVSSPNFGGTNLASSDLATGLPNYFSNNFPTYSKGPVVPTASATDNLIAQGGQLLGSLLGGLFNKSAVPMYSQPVYSTQPATAYRPVMAQVPLGTTQRQQSQQQTYLVAGGIALAVLAVLALKGTRSSSSSRRRGR